MEKVCPFCGKPVSDGDTVCAACGRPLDEINVSRTEKTDSVQETNGSGNAVNAQKSWKKPAAWIAAAALVAGLCYAARMPGSPAGVSAAAAQITAPAKKNPVSGTQITTVTKPLYIIKEDGIAYTNIQWAKALCPELGDYIPADIPEVEAQPNNTVKISGNSVTITLAPLAGITPVVFSDLGDGSVSPSSIPDEEIEIVYGYRDGITLRGTITDYGTTKALAPGQHIHYGKHSGEYDKNVFSDSTIYYLNGTINQVHNDIRGGSTFTSGYKETIYHHDGMYLNMKKTHGQLYTYPGVTETGKRNTYDSNGEINGVCDVEYQAFSRFEILYFPDEDLFQMDIILLDQGSVEAEASDGAGRHEKESIETDHIYNITTLSDYTEYKDVDEWFDYMGDNYITVYK